MAGDDDAGDATDKIADMAGEEITLARGAVWLLRIAAATGAFSMLAHGLEFLHDIGLM